MAERLTEGYRGSNKIKVGKGNKGLVIDFSAAKPIQFGKHSPRRLKTCRGISQSRRKGAGSSHAVAQEWLQGVMTVLPSRRARHIPKAMQPQLGQPRARRGEGPLAEPLGNRDVPQGVPGWPPIVVSHYGHGA